MKNNDDENLIAVTPLYDRVIVKRDEGAWDVKDGEKTLLFIPDAAKEKLQTGRVVAAGEGKPDDKEIGGVRPLQVKVGDHVLFGKYDGFEVEIFGEKFIIFREDQLFGILHD
jgi:chaperonin GroES